MDRGVPGPDGAQEGRMRVAGGAVAARALLANKGGALAWCRTGDLEFAPASNSRFAPASNLLSRADETRQVMRESLGARNGTR